MNEVSVFRLYVLRATYLLLVVGVGTMIWPLLLDSPETAEHFRGVTWCLLSTVALLALLGLRYPLKMLPLLFFELTWKATWVIAIGLPVRAAHIPTFAQPDGRGAHCGQISHAMITTQPWLSHCAALISAVGSLTARAA